ncbi:phosphatase PAP2 family protein [Kitasatospora griseola]|uniref:phosphatase PAP2 family protein n=1 Tax=Kitasatospora griseola TaxID=2064 RepID=UPI0006972A55|nr:phosphatase PAP2 family protein [Kitasatospora griseola]
MTAGSTGPRWALIGCWAAFGVVTLALAAQGWTAFGFEQAVLDWCVAHRPDVAVTAATVVTACGSAPLPYLMALAAGALAVRRVRGPVAVVLFAPTVWLLLGQGLRQLLMHGFGRPRPPLAARAVHASGFSFPSGHAFTAAAGAGLLALAVALARPSAARLAAVCAVVFAAAVGASRVYLGVHWALDVLGGWLLAAGWLALGTLLVCQGRDSGAVLLERRPGGSRD